MQVDTAIKAERALLAHVPDLAVRLAQGDVPPGPGHWAEIEPTGTCAGMPCGNVILCHATDVYFFPRRGLLLRSDGALLQSSAAGSRLPIDRIGRLPGMTMAGAALRFDPPKGIRRIDQGMVWMNFGAGGNYGHFMFDALPALAWAQQAGIVAQFPPLAPKLTRWQRDLIGIAQVATPIDMLADRPVRIDHVVYTSCLNHYLHRNGALLKALSARFVPPRPDRPGDGPPIYFSRRGFTGRIMVNEAELERALRARGVAILRPEKMRVADQLAAVAATRCVIGASGAALANLCVLGPGARLVEIRPGPVREPWLDLATAQLGIDHRIIAAEGPLPRGQVPLLARIMQLPRAAIGRYHYAYRADIAGVLAAIDG